MRFLPFATAFVGLALAVALVRAADSGWSVEAGPAIVGVKGVRPYDVPRQKLRQNDTGRVLAGFVRINRELGPNWSLSVGYGAYGEMRGIGASGNSDIFNRSEISLPVVIPLEIQDRIQEFTFEGRWQHVLSRRWSWHMGPVVSCFLSEAELGSSLYGGPLAGPVAKLYRVIARYRETDVRLGGSTGITLGLGSRWSAALDYRYAKPPGRELHLGYISVRRYF